MNLTDLEVSMKNFMPTHVEIETDEDGQVIILTGLRIGEDGELEEIDD